MEVFVGGFIRYFSGDIFTWRVIYVSLIVVIFAIACVFDRPKRKPERRLPSTPYDYVEHVYNHSKLGILACIICVVSLIPILMFMQDIEIIHVSGSQSIEVTSSSPAAIRVIFVAYLFTIPFFYYALVKIGQALQTPVIESYRQFREKTEPFESSVTSSRILNDVASKLGLDRKPKLLLTEAGIPHAFGKREKETIVVVSKKEFESLERDELETMFTHELWHAKSDVQIRYLKRIEDPVIVCYCGLILLWIEGFFGLVQLTFATSTISWPFRFIISEWYPAPTPFLANPVVFALSAIPLVFSCLVVVNGLTQLSLNLLKYAAYSFDQEEYYTDAMTLLTTQQLLPLICGIIREEETKPINRDFIRNYYITSEEFSLNLSDYRQMLTPALLKSRGDRRNNRIKQAILIDKLISTYTSVRIAKKTSSFSSSSLFGLQFSLYFSPYSRAMDKLEKDTIKKVYKYTTLHGDKFNLVERAKSLNVEITDAFTVFACLLLAGIIG